MALKRDSKYRNVLTMAFVAIMLFNYANATLFWHCHKIGDYSIFHSHIYWKTHGTGESSGGHTPGQLQIIDVVCHAVFTADAIPDIHLYRVDVFENVLIQPMVSEVERGFSEILSLRGPPRLV